MGFIMKILCTICARGGSQGVKNKNVIPLKKKPLIAHSIIQAKKTGLFNHIAVSSDSSLILSTAKKWGADYLIERPAELATSTAAKIPVIQHAVLAAEAFYHDTFDLIVDLDATAPLRTVDDITESLALFLSDPNASNLITACPSHKSPYFNMVEMDVQHYAHLVKQPEKSVTRRQDAPACFDMNASIYIWKRDVLFKNLPVVSDHTLLYVMPQERSIDIDTQIDLALVRLLARKRRDMD